MADNEARLDKWLWASRIFKTRSIAADACKNGRVMVNDVLVKPSRVVKVGDKYGSVFEMLKDPKNWRGHYTQKEPLSHQLRRFSYSDRSRYYMTVPEVQAAMRSAQCGS